MFHRVLVSPHSPFRKPLSNSISLSILPLFCPLSSTLRLKHSEADPDHLATPKHQPSPPHQVSSSPFTGVIVLLRDHKSTFDFFGVYQVSAAVILSPLSSYLVILLPLFFYPFTRQRSLVAYDPRRHQGMTLRRRRSRHPRASSPLDKRRRRMPSFTTPSEDLISPRHISQGSRAWSYLSSFYFIMNFISLHVFKRAFAYLLLSLLGFRVGSSLFRDPIR